MPWTSEGMGKKGQDADWAVRPMLPLVQPTHSVNAAMGTWRDMVLSMCYPRATLHRSHIVVRETAIRFDAQGLENDPRTLAVLGGRTGRPSMYGAKTEAFGPNGNGRTDVVLAGLRQFLEDHLDKVIISRCARSNCVFIFSCSTGRPDVLPRFHASSFFGQNRPIVRATPLRT